MVEGDLGMVGGGWGIWLGLGVDGGALVGDLSCKHKCKNTNTQIQLRKYKYRPT